MSHLIPHPREMAYRLHERGLCVIPVPPPDWDHDGKTPIIKWREFQTRRPTVEELDAWFSEDAWDGAMNLAVITGAISGVVVIDVDTRHADHWIHLPWTPWHTETAKGEHHWYQHPGGVVANRVRLVSGDGRLPIDVRGDGGYVMAPGSVHESGIVYTAVGDWTIPRTQLPVFNPDWLPRPNTPTRVTNHERTAHTTSCGDVVTRARLYLAKIPAPDIGCGSDLATFIAACRLVRGFALDAVDAEHLLWEWCGNRPGWTRAWVAQKVDSALEYGTQPFGDFLR